MIAVENLTVRSGGFCLQGISFEIPAGAHAVLVGEHLMRAPSPGQALRELRGEPA